MHYIVGFFWGFYLIFVFLPVGVLATILTATLMSIGCSLGDHRAWGYYPGQAWARFLCLLSGCRVQVKGREYLHAEQSYVFAANHASLYDIFLIYGWIGVSFKWIMKKELRKAPFIGRACAAAGHIFINRKGGKQAYQCMQRAKEILRNGISVVVFPEGSRTCDGQVGRFKRGAFEIAKDMQLPVVPISLSGCYEAMPRWRKYPLPHPLTLTFHTPVDFQPTNPEEEKALIEQIRATVIAGLNA